MMIRLFFVVSVLVLTPSMAQAQQAVFNVPSSDVLERGIFYIETDQYFQPQETESGRQAFSLLRSVAGVGGDVELGVNIGAFDYLHSSSPFVDFTMKWRPFLYSFGNEEKPGAVGVYVGNHIGIGINGDNRGDLRDLIYAATTLKAPVSETRVAVGPYYATKSVFDNKSRAGMLATFEQPIPGVTGLVLAADWFSGRGGYLTPGLIYTKGPLTFYLGYGLANTGRKDDLLTIEIGYTFK